MKTSNGMKFWISLSGKNDIIVPDDVLCKITSKNVINGIIRAPENLQHTCFYDEIVWLIDSIEPHIEALQSIGICMNESSVWMIYEYFAQCNMEYDSNVLSRIGKLGIKLCVSCYQDDTLTNREYFYGTNISSPKKGISLSITSAADVKENEIFKIEIVVENERENDSFIFTSIGIDNSFLENFEIIECNNSTPRIIEEWQAKNIIVDEIIKSNNKYALELRLKAIKRGIHRGRFRIHERWNYIEESMIVVVES